MVSYHQAIWVDCNDYDLIDSDDLDKYPEAYSAFCDSPDGADKCLGQELDDVMYFGGLLPDKQWAFIYDNDLTVRKAYNFEQWNIIYDLGNGDGFYTESGLNEYCKDKLNAKWFILDEANDEKVFDSTISNMRHYIKLYFSYNQSLIAIAVFVSIMFILRYLCKLQKSKLNKSEQCQYGSV